MSQIPFIPDGASMLRRISDCVREGRPIDTELARHRSANAADAYFLGDISAFIAALGLNAAGPGKPDARRVLINRRA